MLFSVNISAPIAARFIFLVISLIGGVASTYGAEFTASKEQLTLTALSADESAFLKKLKQKQLDQLFTVAVLDEQGQLLGQVWGTVEREPETLKFVPRFPFDDNRQYHARIQLGKDEFTQSISERFAFITEDHQPQSQITAVYPSQKILPENLFKFYIHFSHPMGRGQAYRYIQLLDENQIPVELPFLELTQELWDPSGKRFTLLFDPGRTKQGIKPNRDMGLPLQEGKQFTLVIDSNWKDATGLPLINSFRKSFSVSPQDALQPSMGKWNISLPRSGSRNPVIVEFEEPLDHAQLQNALWLESESGKVIEGVVDIKNEMQWRFTPSYGWRTGEYRLVAKSYLEDRAANSLGRAFEVLREDADPAIPETYHLSFELNP
jgi:hypothetical protein